MTFDMATLWFEVAVSLGFYALGQTLLVRFAVRTPPGQRLLKLALFVALTSTVSVTLGRTWFYGLLAALAAAIVAVHALWLPRHGVNGWTGEKLKRGAG